MTLRSATRTPTVAGLTPAAAALAVPITSERATTSPALRPRGESGGERFAAQCVLAPGDGFQMVGIHASAIAAQVVDNERRIVVAVDSHESDTVNAHCTAIQRDAPVSSGTARLPNDAPCRVHRYLGEPAGGSNELPALRHIKRSSLMHGTTPQQSAYRRRSVTSRAAASYCPHSTVWS